MQPDSQKLPKLYQSYSCCRLHCMQRLRGQTVNSVAMNVAQAFASYLFGRLWAGCYCSWAFFASFANANGNPDVMAFNWVWCVWLAGTRSFAPQNWLQRCGLRWARTVDFSKVVCETSAAALHRCAAASFHHSSSASRFRLICTSLSLRWRRQKP